MKPKSPVERMRTQRAKHGMKSCTLSNHSSEPSADFPPAPLDESLSNIIIEKARSRMNTHNISESECAVCGELKPVRDMSWLKSVKRQLHILEVPGVTRVERKECSVPQREYKGPILDYNCSIICDSCRSSIRNSKIPKLALANGLWIGDVPPHLKCLNFVEKMLVARIQHTCAYVKVASGMRKMTANVSPVPKVYKILPPPCDDLDEVLQFCILVPASPPLMIWKDYPSLYVEIKALEWLKLNLFSGPLNGMYIWVPASESLVFYSCI